MIDVPPVTWLLPVRNGMPYLIRTLASIAGQTYPDHRLLAWDNGSSDGTLEELQRWIPQRIPGFVVYERPLRLGASLAAMVEMAETELCARIDGDDINLPDRLSRQVDFLLHHPQVGVLGGQADFIDENDRPISGWSFSTDDATIRWRSLWMAHFAHSTVMFRRSLILKAGNYRDCQPYEDMELWLRLSRFCEYANLAESLIQYRRSSTSLTGKTVDFKSSFREGARLNADRLFPGYSAAEAMALWDAAYPDVAAAPSRFRYLNAFNNVATAVARQVGKPDNYFQSTAFFAEQRYHIRRRWLERNGLGFVSRLRQFTTRPTR